MSCLSEYPKNDSIGLESYILRSVYETFNQNVGKIECDIDTAQQRMQTNKIYFDLIDNGIALWSYRQMAIIHLVASDLHMCQRTHRGKLSCPQ